MTVGMILGDVLGAKLVECRTAGTNILREAVKNYLADFFR